MKWRGSQAESRKRYLAKFNVDEADAYDGWVGRLSREDEDAYLSDLERVFSFRQGMTVLDAGAGTGTMCQLLSRLDGLAITALEPSPAMLAKLKSKPELEGVIAVEGFCDGNEDRTHFKPSQFELIVSRQLANGLFDPLTAFRNWLYWLSPGGTVILIDGFYGRSAWTGKWEQEIDVLPLAACQTIALIPYLLEHSGFHIESVQVMEAVNQMPSTKTTRYVVVASKVG